MSNCPTTPPRRCRHFHHSAAIAPSYRTPKAPSCSDAAPTRPCISLFFGDAGHQHDGRDGAFVLHPMGGVAVRREGVARAVFLGDLAAVLDDLSRQDVGDLGPVLAAMRLVGGS